MWHEFKIKVVEKQHTEMNVNNIPYESSKIDIDMDTITRYYGTVDQNKKECTVIVFNDGDQIEVEESYKKVRELRIKNCDNHYKMN